MPEALIIKAMMDLAVECEAWARDNLTCGPQWSADVRKNSCGLWPCMNAAHQRLARSPRNSGPDIQRLAFALAGRRAGRRCVKPAEGRTYSGPRVRYRFVCCRAGWRLLLR